MLTSGPLSSSAPECLSSSLKEYRASLGAVVLGSQLAILVERRAGTKGFNIRASLFVGPRLFVVFPQGVQGVPWRRRARLPASDPCGRTCRNFATCRTTSSSVPSRLDAGPMAPSSDGPNATRPQNVVPAVKTRLLFRALPIHDHNRRTGLPSRLPTRSTVTSTGYITNLHSSRGRSDEQRRTSRIRKGELTRRRSLAPVPAPLIISEGIYFFLRTHPLEVRWSWN